MSSISCAIARPPEPCERSTRPFLRSSLRRIGLALRSRDVLLRAGLARLAKPAVGPMRGAGAFGRHHAGAHRRLRRAERAEQLAIARLLHAAQDRAAFAGRIVLRRLRPRGRSAVRRRRRRRPRAASARCRAASRGRAIRTCRAVSNIAATSACALTLPSRVTARIYSFSTSARPSLIWRTSIRIACITSSGSKPAMTTGLP